MAVAGFSPEDIDVTVEKSVLTIATKSQDDTAPEDEGDRVYLRQGLARRSFRRSYRLGEYIVVRDAKMENGLLRVHLAREIPEDARPRQIAITSAG
jgi:molecular chaperone IbpA